MQETTSYLCTAQKRGSWQGKILQNGLLEKALPMLGRPALSFLLEALQMY